jgi:hypothetical protein
MAPPGPDAATLSLRMQESCHSERSEESVFLRMSTADPSMPLG